jgi:hypothetical protein
MDDALFAMHETPFEPGTSPFHCKGVMIIDALLYLDEQVAGGRAAVLAGINDPKLRLYLSQPFVAGGWYDVFCVIALHRRGALLLGRPYLDVVRGATRAAFPREVRGIYKFLLKLGSPEMMMRNMHRVASQFYDFTRTEVSEVRPRTFEHGTGGLPVAVAPSYMATSEAAVLQLLDFAGARGVRHRWLSPEDDGEAHGLKLTKVRREVTWDE